MAKTEVNVKRWLFRQMFQNAMEHVLGKWGDFCAWWASFNEGAMFATIFGGIFGAFYLAMGSGIAARTEGCSVLRFWMWNGLFVLGLFLIISFVMLFRFFEREVRDLPRESAIIANYFKQQISRLRQRFFGDSSRFARVMAKRKTAMEVANAQLAVLKGNVSASAFVASGQEKLEQAIAGLEKEVGALKEYSDAAEKLFDEMEKMLAAEKFQAFLAQLEAVGTASRIGNCMAPVITGYLGELDVFNAQFRGLAEEIPALPFPKMTMKLK